MATKRISVFATFVPDTSGKVWFEPYSILATNDVWQHHVARIDEDGNNNAQVSTRVGLYGQFPVPKDYVGSPALVVVWTATVTTGDVEWDADIRAVGGNDTESLDQAGTQESVNALDSAPSAAHERLEASLALTAGNLAVDDTVEAFVARDGTDAGDTMAAAALIHDIIFEYTDA